MRNKTNKDFEDKMKNENCTRIVTSIYFKNTPFIIISAAKCSMIIS